MLQTFSPLQHCKNILFLILILNLFTLTFPMKVIKKEILPQFKIKIVGTNDIHGAAYPTILSRKDTNERYKYGGLVYMARIIEILKEQMDGSILYLDAGDQFQGGLQASKTISSGEIISDYFNHMNLEAGSIGNHEFDFGPEFLDQYLNKVEADILSANLIDTSDNEYPLRNQENSKIYSIPIKDRNPYIDDNFTELKIGVIGLSTIQTPTKTSGFVDGLFPETYKFQNYKQIVQKQAKQLQKKGVHAIVLLTHVGNECSDNSDYGIWTIRNQEASSSSQIPCKADDEIFKLLDDLPEGLIDVIVQGHRHTISHYFYKGVPIIGTTNGGYYLNTIDLQFSLSGSQAYLDPLDISIEGPIPVCERIFSKTHKCEYVPEDQLPEAGELRNWQFHSQDVYADETLQELYDLKYSKQMKEYEFEICDNFIETPLIKDYASNSSLGNLITNVIASALSDESSVIPVQQFDFVLLNGGGFRTTWYPGVIRYAELHSMFPFDNDIVRFEMTGKDLKTTMEILQNGQKKYYPTWGLSQEFVVVEREAGERGVVNESEYLELSSLKMVTTATKSGSDNSASSAEEIRDEEIYRGFSLGFLINGGDDFAKVLSAGVQVLNKEVYPTAMKELIQEELEKMSSIDSSSMENVGGVERIIFK